MLSKSVLIRIFLCHLSSAPCGENYIDVSSSPHILTSPLQQYYYPNNIHCEWFVHGAPGYDVVVVFLSFYTELDFDYLLVEKNSSLVAKFTGDSHSKRMSLYTPDVKLIFVTDYIVQEAGFELMIQQMQEGKSRLLSKTKYIILVNTQEGERGISF